MCTHVHTAPSPSRHHPTPAQSHRSPQGQLGPRQERKGRSRCRLVDSGRCTCLAHALYPRAKQKRRAHMTRESRAQHGLRSHNTRSSGKRTHCCTQTHACEPAHDGGSHIPTPGRVYRVLRGFQQVVRAGCGLSDTCRTRVCPAAAPRGTSRRGGDESLMTSLVSHQ